MKAKFEVVQNSPLPVMALPRSLGAYNFSDDAMQARTQGSGRAIALIRGTMLELVRRDGRDLTARQLTTLLSVYLEDETLSVSRVATLLNISRPGVTRILDRLVDADLVSRAEDATDRRRVLVRRTRAGAKFVRDLIEVADHVSADLNRLS